MIISLLSSNYEFLFYLSIFFSIYILYKKWKDLKLINKSFILLSNNKDNTVTKRKIFYVLILILFIICFYIISDNNLGINSISHSQYRIIKIILGFSISFISLYINIKEKGFIS